MTTPETPLATDMLEAVEVELRTGLELAPDPYGGIAEMVRHHFGWDESSPEARGKRVRPLLTLLCASAAGAEWRSALPAAAAVEWIHNFTLIHDDIEDSSTLRRGRPTVWSQWGVPQAVNTGDFLHVVSHLSCHRLLDLGVASDVVLAVHGELDLACLRLCQGQHLDISFETRGRVATTEYLTMISGKTAALLGAACAVGATLGRPEAIRRDAYRRFGVNLGMAFQLLDDQIGIWGDPRQTGKPDSDDLRSGKKTYPVLHGLQYSREFAEAWAAGRIHAPDIAALQRLLEASGARRATRSEAERYTSEAYRALEEADGQPPAAEELRSFAARLLQRDR